MIWRLPTLPPVRAVPLALPGLTTLFGMGRGEHRHYYHHEVFQILKSSQQIGTDNQVNSVFLLIPDYSLLSTCFFLASCELVTKLSRLISDFTEFSLYSTDAYCSVIGKFRVISIARLNPLLNLHLQPINVVIYNVPIWNSHLGASFALRCFQHLSLPSIATLRCTWRHNSYTSGQSNPVLSY